LSEIAGTLLFSAEILRRGRFRFPSFSIGRFMTDVSHAQQPAALGRGARGAVLWGSGFTLLRDVVQFAMMLVLVRILSADDYCRAGLAQAVLGMISVVSFAATAPHALQLRDPATIDWQAHFTAGTVINLSLFVLTIFVAGLLSLTKSYAGAAAPLAGRPCGV